VVVRVEDDGDPGDAWRDLLEQLQPFSVYRRVGHTKPCDIAAGPREALNKALADGIAHVYENDRYRACLLAQGPDSRRAVCQNCVRCQPDQFCRVGFVVRPIARGKAVVDPDILPLDPPETFQCLSKSHHKWLSVGVVLAKKH
jgi:hypothetical protein